MPRTLWRFPGPIALARVLDGGPATLHHPDATVVYLGDLGLWAWPGVAEFGALSIFDADRLQPRPGPVDGWFVVDPAPLAPDDVIYVPDRRCAVAVAGARDAAEARRRMPDHYGAAVEEARRAIERYDRISRRVVDRLSALDGAGCGAAGLPERWHGDARTPLHMLPADRRDRLARALARAVGRIGDPRSPEAP